MVASSLKLTFDGTDVTVLSTITDTPTGAMIAFQAPGRSPLGTTHTVTVQWKDNQATPTSGSYTWSYKEGPYNDNNLFIEVEDFNTGSGQYIPSTPGHPFNEKGLYNTLGATPGIDYNDTGDGQESNLYRTEGVDNIPHVNMIQENDPISGPGPRPGFETVSDYKIGWTDPSGDWYNYTRNYGAGGVYNVYIRVSHGDAAATMGGRLESVDDATTATQTTSPLGHARAAATGGWDTFTLVPMKADDGSLATVSLSGVKTLRYSPEANGGDINYLMLVPLPGANHCPTSSSQALSVNQNGSANFQLGASDADGDYLRYSITQGPAHGSASVQALTGAGSYSPAQGYCGSDSFKFKVNDGDCDSAEATVSITIVNCNACPVARRTSSL